MKKISIKTILLAGFLMITAGFAQAAGTDATVDCNADGTPVSGGTVCIQVGGSSAAKAMGAQFALEFLDPTQPIFHYTSAYATSLTTQTVTMPTGATYVFGSGDLNAWTGTLLPSAGGPAPAVIRYTPSHSMDGFAKLECQDLSNSQQLNISPGTYYDNVTPGYCGGTNNPANLKTIIPIANVDSQIPVMDFSSSSCTGVVPTTKTGTTVAGTSVSYTDYAGCNATLIMGETMGASDVDPSSYHQTGPSNWHVFPLDSSALTTVDSFFIPFQFAVSSTVQYSNPKTGVASTPVLTRDQVNAIFNNGVANWNLLPGFEANNGKPYLCMRNVGSGTKAALNATIMKNGSGFLGETSLPGANGSFNFNSTDMKICILSHPNSIGYFNADGLPTAGITGVILDGVLPHNDPNFTDGKATIKDGLYPFVTREHLMYRTGADPSIDGGALTGPQHSLMSAFAGNANNNVYLTKFGAGGFWAASGDMCSAKSGDNGTFKPTSPAPAGCPAN
jgi:hypothetical protein